MIWLDGVAGERMTTETSQIWRSIRALRAHVLASPPTEQPSECVVEGRLMHMRRVSRRCSFYDLASADASESSSHRVEVLLKIVDGEISTDDVDAIRHRISLGDIVHVRCRLELLASRANDGTSLEDDLNDPPLLLVARDIVTVVAWRETHPNEPFVPVATVHKKTHPEAPLQSQPAIGQETAAVVHCKFWINTGTCHQGDQCLSYHALPHEMKDARLAWLAQRRHDKRARAAQDADPHDAHGKTSKHQRARVFVEWFVTTFGEQYLRRGAGVIDVAGGRGNVSFELWNKRRISSTLIDPRPLKLSRDQHKHFKKQKKAGQAVEDALVPQKLALFNTTTFFEDPLQAALVKDASCLVGMHPDEATDSIVDVAVAHDKPFAIVPCCVFGQSFPDRRGPDGVSKVLSYDDLVEYLVAKHSDIQRAFLPFEGKNLVLYRLPRQAEANE